jgi:hypothetical protein
LQAFFERLGDSPEKTSATAAPISSSLQTITDDDMPMAVASDEANDGEGHNDDPMAYTFQMSEKVRPALPKPAPSGPNDPNLTLAPFNMLLEGETCPYCQATRYADAVFCHRCGKALVARDQLETCRHCRTPLVPKAHFCYMCGKRALNAPELTLQMVDGLQYFTFLGDQAAYLVGRQVPEQNHFVDVDLGEIGQRKISRQHARLMLHDKAWYVEDLGSKAGTRINNTRLLPNQPMQLEHGMLLYFADLKFKISIQED